MRVVTDAEIATYFVKFLGAGMGTGIVLHWLDRLVAYVSEGR